MQIGVDQIVNIGENNIIDPKKLLCSICFTLNIQARECLNKKCKKLFCINCINSLKNLKNDNENLNKNNNKKIPCPFCTVEADFYKAEENLNKIISEIKLECTDNCCTTKLSVEEYLEHNLSKKNLKYCYKCKDSTFLNYTKCNNCHNSFCNDCNFTKNCLGCEFSICENCISSKFKNSENFLCGICEPQCKNCDNSEDAEEICTFCDSYLCGECYEKCEFCNLIFCKGGKCRKKCEHFESDKLEGQKCYHQEDLRCGECYPKCKYKENKILSKNEKEKKTNKKIGCNNENKSKKNCKTCGLSVCIKDCSHRCKKCKETICENCCKLCKICKNIVCGSCSQICDDCPQTFFLQNQLVYCDNCEIDTIRKCQVENCKKKLCINCWNVCNYCDLILCGDPKHSNNCLNCEEKMCEKHFHNCTCCNKEKDHLQYKKLCLKNCTNKCSFCSNVTNTLCSVENHKKNYVNNLNCNHNVCGECLKGCAKCKNVVVSCPKCIVNYYFHKCKFCSFYLCNVCSRYCNNCEDNYCPYNKCINCNGMSTNNCSNCVNFEGEKNKSKRMNRNNCNKCMKSLENCEKCSNKYICGKKCYFEYKKKFPERINEKDENYNLDCRNICEMFECSDCFQKSKILDAEINSKNFENTETNLEVFSNGKNQNTKIKIESKSERTNNLKDNLAIFENKYKIKEDLKNIRNVIVNNTNLNVKQERSIVQISKKKEKVTCLCMCNIF